MSTTTSPGEAASTYPITDLERQNLEKAIKFMSEKFGEKPTLEHIADHVGLSKFHFHRRFTLAFGITPKDKLTELQIEACKTMLRQGKELNEIARVAGFSHQSHFTSRFKSKTGKTPMQWRKDDQVQQASTPLPESAEPTAEPGEPK